MALKAGDSLVSSPESLFDLAGVYPLKMYVAGVLNKSHTSDDLAVFVDLKTTWVIQGLGALGRLRSYCRRTLWGG